MQAARIVKVNEPLEVIQLETSRSRGSEVLIKVQSSGVCHSNWFTSTMSNSVLIRLIPI
jgi:alcohol dehydrogenase, propanol-preferring